MTRTSSRVPATYSSKKEQSSVIGQHAQDRLYRDNKFRQKWLPEAGPAVCTSCGAICYEKHWFIDFKKSNTLSTDPAVRQVLCPGCHRVKEQIYEGQVILESHLLTTAKDTIMGLIKHVEGKCWHDNPMSRIATMTDLDNGLEIHTTSRWLATRIGKELHKAYKGELEIKPSPRQKFVRVYWTRA